MARELPAERAAMPRACALLPPAPTRDVPHSVLAGGERQLVAEMDNGGTWLDWWA